MDRTTHPTDNVDWSAVEDVAPPTSMDLHEMAQLMLTCAEFLRDHLSGDIVLVGSIGEIRRTHRKTQGDVAEKMGVTQSRVSAIEASGIDVGLPTLIRYATALGGRLELSMVFDDGKKFLLRNAEATEPLADVRDAEA